jgi:HAD superfamily hydrolase (TIGR01484 family)
LKLIVSDIEGCITPGRAENIQLEWVDRLAHRIDELSREGTRFTLCSGRPKAFVEFGLQLLGLDQLAICENGVFVYDIRNDVLLMNPAITGELRAEMRKLRERIEPLADSWGARIEPGKEICVTLLPGDGMASAELAAKVSASVEMPFASMTYSASAVDITPSGVDKGSGVRFLSSITGIDLKDTAGIGDSRGDMSFLNILPRRGCPANAFQEVKNIASYVSPYPYCRGVLDVVNKFTGA